VLSYFETGDEAMTSEDGESTYVVASFDPDADDGAAVERLQKEFADAEGITLGGGAVVGPQVGRIIGEDLARRPARRFLLSRIKEARESGADDTEAVAVGLGRTGRIITAAALLFCVAIGAFATSQIVIIKELGVGAALAVLIDATIVRALLVPSLMKLLGRRNWWSPRH
jgi:uncharacterized membrane protein YdfJ with MMPL/SSD domain